MKMEITSHPSNGLKWKLDNDVLFEIDEPMAIDGVRLNTDDGPGWYESAPTVMYVDNFAIDNGTLLSSRSLSLDSEFEGKVYYGEGEIVIENSQTRIARVDVYNIHGQLIKSLDRINQDTQFRIPLEQYDNLVVVIIYDNENRKYARKLLNWE